MRLLATQSHVVHGYVGNKAATFPLQCLGWDVDCCNTVQFSNHTGYGLDNVKGDATTGTQLDQLLMGVFKNFPHEYCALLSGYLPHAEAVRRMGDRYGQYKSANPETLWLMDPVMGDEGQLYVSEDVVPEYKHLVFNPNVGVDIITPNQFELEVLHGSAVTTLQELKETLSVMHEHIPIIVLTSLDARLFQDPHHIYCAASQKDEPPVILKVPLIDSYFTGVGDIFSALLMDRIYRNRADLNLVSCVNDVLNIVQTVLKVTHKFSPRGVSMGSQLMKDSELRLIECRDLYAGNEVIDFTYKTLY
ncbi:ZYBA0S09-01464g1_1 [Zygosaccharomyces bailii CLIB 213]|uniref:pyridoxal kinase n=1 Tax=Zygosaccharomyces bailii (strain CLIB 213 / ATCC 58445 / CBS 680 / BCRC 21525 / NBRC 1098 / NCYC 1416 / NRRL Y-2227) TaxID=1333698 RepID=A0A8J2T8T1_ZYGB2|nr:ZYBA0S09-01464g1_1 [Zygosaccharomyces bailii CLIB 213]